jgi:peptide/nickel transport system permease protein
MYKYVIRRLLLSIPVLLLSSLIVFGLMRVMPGDALTVLMGESGNVSAKDLQKLQKELGLDRPYVEQYGIWLWQMVSLNPGYSIFTNEPITVALKKAVPVTLELAALAIILGLIIAIPVGVLSGPSSSPSRRSGSTGSRRSATSASGSRRGRTCSSFSCPRASSASAYRRRRCA